jgi:short-chain fatty acids transporter
LVSTFLTAGLVNLFVPSGGGQWGVQGPVVVDAALRLDVPVERAVLALAYGDEWTNMLQPFWALALLGVTRLEARDIVGYTTLIMLLTGPLYVGALLFL